VAVAVRGVEAATDALPSSGAGDGALVAAVNALLAALPGGDVEALSQALVGFCPFTNAYHPSGSGVLRGQLPTNWAIAGLLWTAANLEGLSQALTGAPNCSKPAIPHLQVRVLRSKHPRASKCMCGHCSRCGGGTRRCSGGADGAGAAAGVPTDMNSLPLCSTCSLLHNGEAVRRGRHAIGGGAAAGDRQSASQLQIKLYVKQNPAAQQLARDPPSA